MAEDETKDENVTPEGETPAEEAPAAEAPVEEPPAEEPAPEETPVDEPDPEDAPVAEPAAEEPVAEEPVAEEPAAEEPAAEEPAAEEPGEEIEETPKRKADEAPGANLEPIRLDDDRPVSAEERARLEAEEEERARLEAEATADGTDEPLATREAKVEIPSDTRVQATGKRKSAVARVIVSQGAGGFQVNERELAEYFPRSLHQTVAMQALSVSGYEGQVDVRVRVHGGGVSGQADAVRHGIARALCEIDPELRGELKRRGMLTRDARVKERYKAGLKKARKRPQFSKR